MAEEHTAVTGRPSDVAPPNTTLAERAKQRKASVTKVSTTEVTESKPVTVPRKSAKSK